MTTVIDPAGTPVPVYSRSGTTIVPLTAGLSPAETTSIAQVVGDDGVEIPSYSQTTVAVVTCSGSSGAYRVAAVLPVAAEIGDVVEVYPTGSRDARVYPPVGEAIGSRPASTGAEFESGVGVALLSGTSFRKVSASQWMPIGAA